MHIESDAPAGPVDADRRRRPATPVTPFRPVLLGLAVAASLAGVAHAGGEVSQVLVDELSATPFRYTVDGRTYTWGLGRNQIMRGFVADGIPYGYTDTVTRVELRRDDIGDVAEGNPCGVFVERLGGDGDALAADYPSDGSGTGECDMPELLASRIVNRGALDLFSNVLPDAKNIERADFVFDHAVLAPFVDGGRERAGHVVGEKRGNNPVRMAAILALDVFGQPAEYGPLVQIDAKHCAPERLCYGETDLVHEYSFFQNELRAPQGFPSETGQSVETVSMAFVDLKRLGLHPGQRYFGFSLFADDVDRNVHTLTDPATFPDDTSDDHISTGDDADIYGGLAGYFVADELNGVTGRVYLDENDDGTFGEGDAGIADIGLVLYADSNGDGVFDPLLDEALCDSIDSDGRGLFQFPGLADGSYFVVLHEGDPDLPGGLTLVPGSNPQMLVVSGADVDGVDFAFSNGDSSGDGASAGGDGAGSGDGNGDGGQSGGTGTGGNDDGGTDDGGTDTGSDDGGGEIDGGSGDGSGGAATGGSDGTGNGTSDGSTGGGAGGTTGGDAGGDAGGTGDGAGADTSGGDAGGTGDGGGDGDGGTDGGVIGAPDDDSSTNAVPDRATTLQGRPVDVDVLANDTDAAGDGLEIVTVNASPDAAITIETGADGRQFVRYAPDFGFFGDDTFMYTIVDGDGTRATGTVLVSVERFSDIDGNGVNDFDECDCTDLTLETGVRGSGVGRMSGATLGALGLALVLLRGRRRPARRAGAGA